MKEYFAYIRVSTKRQGEYGASLPEQRRAIEKYALEQSLAIVEWFEEQETAAKRGRPIFSRMLAKLEDGLACGVIIHKIDRSARNLKDWANLGELIDGGIDVRFAHESIDLHTRGGRLSADIQAVVAADFIRNLRDEIKKGINGRLKEGIYPLPAPIGYLNAGGGKLKSVDPVRGQLVRTAFELYARGAMSLNALRIEMQRRGLTTRGGQPLSVQSLWNVLHNPFYIGLMRLKGRHEVYQGKHSPLVSKATFDRVQDVASGKAALRATKHEFLFRCLVKCSRCGRHLVGELQKKRYVYYRCHSDTCRGTIIREELLDHAIQDRLALLRCDAVEQRHLTAMVAIAKGDGIARIANTHTELTLRLAKSKERLDRLTDAYLDQTIDKELFESRKRSLLGENRSTLDQLEELVSSKSQGNGAFEKLELGRSAYSGYRMGNLVEKRAIIENVCSNFVVREKSPAITLKLPYQPWAEWRDSQNSGAPHQTPRTRARQLLSILLGVDEEQRKESVSRNGTSPLAV